MTKEPLVSIIIPAYNCRRWLGEAIDSALAQTHPHCEIIVIDDGSTDGTGEWVQVHYDSRIRYHWQPNGGVARARNTGLHLAQGDYIQFLDADDILSPEKVARQVAHLESHPEWAVAYCDTYLFREDDLSQMRWVVDDEKDFQLITEIFQSLYKEGEIFHLKDIVDFLSKRPELLELNKHTDRYEGWLKSLAQDRLIR